MSAALLLHQHADQVRSMSKRWAAQSRGRIDADDLAQEGFLALLEMRVEPTHNEDHATARAITRVRGAMIDTTRRHDDLPRQTRAKGRSIAAAECRLEQTLGRRPRDAEIATAANLDLDEYFRVVAQTRGSLSRMATPDVHEHEERDRLDEVYAAQNGCSHFDDPRDIVESAEVVDCLVEAIESLAGRWRVVMALHYIHDRTYIEIASELGVSESRVCQIHKEAIERVREKLRGQDFL